MKQSTEFNETEDSWISLSFKKNLVSVIVPTFNRERLLSEAIQSIHDQTYRPIECVVFTHYDQPECASEGDVP